MCNPPCPTGQVCVDGTRCEYPTAAPAAPRGTAVYEPPPPPPPPEQAFAKRVHSALGFHVGFGGGVDEGGVEYDVATTYGGNLRADIPVARYVLIGPLFQIGAWRPDPPGAAPSRDYYFDLDLFFRGRIPIAVKPSGMQIWGGVPVGLTLSFLGSDRRTLDGFGVGWNIGILIGGAIHFSKAFGMFAEVGWLQHRMSHEREIGTGDVDFRLAQGVFNLGFMFGN